MSEYGEPVGTNAICTAALYGKLLWELQSFRQGVTLRSGQFCHLFTSTAAFKTAVQAGGFQRVLAELGSSDGPEYPTSVDCEEMGKCLVESFLVELS